MISQELFQYEIFLCSLAAIFSLIGVGLIVLFIFLDKGKRDDFCLFFSTVTGPCFLFAIFLFWASLTKYNSRMILTPITSSSSTFLDQNGNLVYEDKIPDKVPTIYEHGVGSGYTIRNNKWVYRIGLSDEYAWEIANHDFILYIKDNKAMLVSGKVVLLNKDIETVTKNMSPDFGWRRDFPGKVQNVAEFLVWSKWDIKRARIERFIFQ